MKKIIKLIICAIFAIISSFFVVPATKNVAAAVNQSDIEISLINNLVNFTEFNSQIKQRTNRLAGSEGELFAAAYINNELGAAGLNLEPKNNQSTINGVQTFNFYDEYTGKKLESQNIIYTIKGASNEQKVVLSVGYDNNCQTYSFDEEGNIIDAVCECEGVNASAGSVAVLLTLAEILPQSYFDFDIEIVFFGASYASNAGAKFYNQSLTKEEREIVLLMVDISHIALGESLYFYDGAFNNEDFFDETLNVKEFSEDMHGVAFDNEYATYGYESAGYSSSTSVFEGDFNVLHMFAGSYDEYVFGGYCEYVDGQNITNTANDSMKYILENHQDDVVENMTAAVTNIAKLVNQQDFVKEMETFSVSWLYWFFDNLNIEIIMFITLFILLLIAIIVQYFISRRSYNFIKENNVAGVMIKIVEEDNKKEQE